MRGNPGGAPLVAAYVLGVALFSLMAPGGPLAPAVQIPGRRYWPVSVDWLATGHVAHTHVAVTGIVRRQRMQGDGDRHIALGGRRAVILAECIPALPCPAPVVGQRITVYGISRWDLEHHWAEVHPCERWEPAP